MEMLVIGVCLCLFTMAIVAVAFRATTRSEASISTVQPGLQLDKAVTPARLFADSVAVPPALSPQQVPIELLLAQIENHVRLERAAAESFIEFPTQALLHIKTTSKFVN